MGFGNLLLLAMWALEGSRQGERRWILRTPAIDLWLATFPALGEVFMPRDEVRFTDQRVMPWSQAARAAGAERTVAAHEPIDMASVEMLLSTLLVPKSVLDRPGFLDQDPDHVVVNVRRGDYYSVPETRAQYGFDVASYVRAALAASMMKDGPASRITVVSDGMDWCRDELAWLTDHAPVEWARSGGPVSDFLAIAATRRLVITNSTFSYWAAHVGNVLRGDNHAEVWAPRFFDRSQNGGRSWLLDERWSIVEDIPGGWDLGSDAPVSPPAPVRP